MTPNQRLKLTGAAILFCARQRLSRRPRQLSLGVRRQRLLSCRVGGFKWLDTLDENEGHHFHSVEGVGRLAGECVHINGRPADTEHLGVADVERSSAVQPDAERDERCRSSPGQQVVGSHCDSSSNSISPAANDATPNPSMACDVKRRTAEFRRLSSSF
jgi:hypothetical protein